MKRNKTDSIKVEVIEIKKVTYSASQVINLRANKK